MIIGIPKETWRDERRVALTQAGVYALVRSGHRVIVQEDAGMGSGFASEFYQQAGATIAFSAEEIFARADCIVKIMLPSLEECSWMGDGKFLFSWAQMGVMNPSVVRRLIKRRTTAIGYELIEDENGNLPVLTTMSEVAGFLLPQIAGRFLETTYGGRGIVLGGLAGIPSSNVVIVGAGMVGLAAARSFLGTGANVMVLDSDVARLRTLESMLNWKVNTALANEYNLNRYVEFADVLVGAILLRGQKTPHVISETMVRNMKPGSVILDVSIDQGGCVETSHPTTLSDPIFVKHGVIHYCVPNIASSVARTASHALNNAVLSYIEETANRGTVAFSENYPLRKGVFLFDGQCTNLDLARLMELDYVDAITPVEVQS